MTIASEANRSGPYACNGVTTHFPFSFRIYDEAHIRVILTYPQGTETTLRLGTDYTVSAVGQSGGGAIDLAVAYASGYQVTLILNVPFTQNIDLENQGAYFAETIERAIDLQTQMSLQLKEQVARSVVLPVTSSVSMDTLTSSVLALAEIQPQMRMLAPIAGDIVTVAGISSAVVAAEGHASTATAAAGVATGKAAEAAASAEAARTWNPAAYSTTSEVETKLGGYVPTARKLKVGAGLSLDGIVGSDEEPAEGNLSGDRLLALNLASKALTPELWNAGVDTTEAPISPAKLAGAVGALASGAVPNGVVVVSASGNYRPSAGTAFILAVLVGGGGGSGAKKGGSSYGHGGYGGCGGVGFAILQVTPGSDYPVIAGAGGNGGSKPTGTGGSGGTTSITINGTIYSVTGGAGGAAGSQSDASAGADGGAGDCSSSCIFGGAIEPAGPLRTFYGGILPGRGGVGNPSDNGAPGTAGNVFILEFGA